RTPEQAPTRTGRLSLVIVFWLWSRGRRLTARIGLVLDPETDCHRERPDLLGLAHPLGDLHTRERVADADPHADQSFEPGGEHARDRDVQRRAAPVEHSCELAHTSVRNREGRALVTDGDDNECSARSLPTPSCGACSARSRANASRSIPESVIPAFLQAST